MQPGELRELLELLREHGVTSYQHDGLSLTIQPGASMAPPVADPAPEEDLPATDMMFALEGLMRRPPDDSGKTS